MNHWDALEADIAFDMKRFKEAEPPEKLSGAAWYLERRKRRVAVTAPRIEAK